MAKRRHRGSEELMLIPFLDILCSLIGVLVLIIVVLVVAQTQKINGRNPEEVAMAQEHMKLLRVQVEQTQANEALKDQLEELAKLKEQEQKGAEKLASLRALLNTSVSTQEQQKEQNQRLLKELDNLMLEIRGLASQEAPLKAAIAELMAEIKKRQPPENKGSPIKVRPGGSGLAKGTKVFFIEATWEKMSYYWDETNKGTVSSAPEVIAADVQFNNYLKAVQAVPQSKLIFLLRDSGMGTFNNGAGWAQTTHGYTAGQIGKLPIPGNGLIDLGMFREFIGTLPVPVLEKKETATPPKAAAAVPAPVAPKP
jgi:hypothetical protein